MAASGCSGRTPQGAHAARTCETERRCAMPRTHHLAIDPARPLAQQPQTGHNRWHEDIPPALDVGPGDTVILETRDAFDGQLSPAATRDDVGALNLGPADQLRGRVYVGGDQPGDRREV